MSGEEAAPIPEETLPAATTAADIEGWLNCTKPSAILALLKDTDFRAAITPIFAGFQPNVKTLVLPLVRSRLVQAAVKDDKIAEKLRGLSETEPKPLPPAPEPKPTKLVPLPALKPDPVPALKAECDARRKERDAARLELAGVRTALGVSVKACTQIEAELDEARLTARKQAERIARLERQMAKVRHTEARLLKALSEDKVSPLPSNRQHGGSPKEPSDRTVSLAWPVAVGHLLDKAEFDTALALAEEVLKTDSDDLDALPIAVRAYEGRKEPKPAFGMARRLLAVQVRREDFSAAPETLLTLLRLTASPEQAEPDARLFFAAFSASESAAVAAARLMLGRLRGISPPGYDWLSDYIRARTPLAPTLMPPPGALGPDDPLPLTLNLGRPVTARMLADAVDKAQIGLVDAARSALQALKAGDTKTFARVWAALEQAASDDPQRLLPLRRVPRGAAVVDGSNVAWFDQESLVHGLPRLRPILALRRALWSKGFFPVVLYADANLPYSIDDRPALMRMRDRLELTFVDAGTAADEVLLRVAKQLGAILVTNDKMEDWDPEHTVHKVRYAISLGGEAHLLSGI